MEQSIAVPLVAFVVLLATMTAGLTTQGWTVWQTVTQAPAGLMRGVAAGLLALASLALGMLTLTTRADFHRAEDQVRMLAQDVLALDEVLRSAADTGSTARTTLFRYTDTLCDLLDGGHGAPRSPATLAPRRLELRQDIESLPLASAETRAMAVARLEIVLRGEASVLSMVPPPGVKWCRPILVAWMAAGLGLLALISPGGLRSAILLAALAGTLSAGMFLLEEMASPFDGRITIEHSIMDEVLYSLAS